MHEDSLRIRSIAESKRGKSHPLQTPRPQSCTAQRLPEDLAVGWEITLARGGYGDQYELVLQQLLLQGNQWPCLLLLWCLTYKADCIQFCDFRVEAQALSEPPERVLTELVATGAVLVSLNPLRDTLEDFFVRRVAEVGDGARAGTGSDRARD